MSLSFWFYRGSYKYSEDSDLYLKEYYVSVYVIEGFIKKVT